MAKSGKRRIPAKQGTKRGRTAPARAIKKSVPAPTRTIVEPPPAENNIVAKHTVTVKALRLGEYGGRYHKPNDVFTMEVSGELPFWVEKV